MPAEFFRVSLSFVPGCGGVENVIAVPVVAEGVAGDCNFANVNFGSNGAVAVDAGDFIRADDRNRRARRIL